VVPIFSHNIQDCGNVAANIPKAKGDIVAPPSLRPWIQLGLGLLVMMAMSSPQYVWTLFTGHFQNATGADLSAVQVTFSLLIILQTWLSPAQGWLIDHFGPPRLIASGAALAGLGWVLASRADSLLALYLTYGLFCGVGTGFVYVGVIGLMVRWFPQRRGFAAGIVAAGYGFGALFTTLPINTMIENWGYRAALVVFGLILGGIGTLAALFLRSPRAFSREVDTGSREENASKQKPGAPFRFHRNGKSSEAAEKPAEPVKSEKGTAPREMLRSRVFWLMFAMMAMMSTGGLMVTSQFAAFARDFGVADAIVLGSAALPLALSFDRLMNGFCRPLFGWVSDRLGRENTMGLAFGLEACAVALMLLFRENPTLFVLLSGLVFFGWGEIFSLFPSTLTDTFGEKHATTNYGFLYMAQGLGSILGGPLAALLRAAAGSWLPIFGLVILLDAATALLALFVLKPMRAQDRVSRNLLVARTSKT
jgi:MFS transporter, OFA family, oxalate/formate antiporter